jgi:anti-sigma B factor antagonist
MKVHWALDGKVAILRPRGDLLGGPETDELVDAAKALVAQGNRALLVDLGDAGIVSSGGWGALLRIRLAYDPAPREDAIRVCNLSNRSHDAWEIIRFGLIFPLYESERDAVRAFAEGLAEPANG